jgi:MFS superfamily sulfate permease-like transporter
MKVRFVVLRLAKLVRLLPETGMIGFTNGLAIEGATPSAGVFVDCAVDEKEWLTSAGDPWQLILTLVHVFVSMAIITVLSKVPKIGKIIPGALMGLLVGTLMT